MFRIAEDYVYAWPVTVRVPKDGDYEEAKFTARFRTVGEERLKQVRAGEVADRDFLAEIIVGFDGVGDEAGTPLTYTEETRDRLIAIPYVMTALIEAYFESLRGIPRKN